MNMKNSISTAFTKNLGLKFLAFIISIGLWLYVNFGNYVPINVYKTVHIEHEEKGYVYIVEPRSVVLKILVVDRILNQNLLKQTEAFIDARVLKDGINIAKVNIKTPIPILMKPDKSESVYVRVIVKKKDQK